MRSSKGLRKWPVTNYKIMMLYIIHYPGYASETSCILNVTKTVDNVQHNNFIISNSGTYL
jgi:hypothetical protein